MNRRDTVRALIALAAASGSLSVSAQVPKVFRIGYLSMGSEAVTRPFWEAVLAGMRDRGYVVGRNLVVDLRYANGDPNLIPALADELIALKPDLLIGVPPVARAMMAKTAITPVVFLMSADPIAEGLVKSLARPGTNATGMSYVIYELISKHIELLTELMPKMSRVALLLPSNLSAADRDTRYVRPAQAVAKAKGLSLVVVTAHAASVSEAFDVLAKERPDALVLGGSTVFNTILRELADAALRLRLPAIYVSSSYVEVGGLVSYGANVLESLRYATSYLDKILKGAAPADLPVEQVSKFEIVLNMKVARAIGLTIPRSFLLRVDRVIE